MYKAESLNSLPQNLTPSLETNLQWFQQIFQGDTTIKVRSLTCGMSKSPLTILFADGMVNNTLVNEHVIEPLLNFTGILPEKDMADYLIHRVLLTNDITENDTFDSLFTEILSGNTVLLMEGQTKALILSTRGFMVRSTSEPPAEKVLQGPREGFTEVMLFNVSMVRRKLCNPKFRLEFRRIGTQTKTMIAVGYLTDIVDPSIVEEVNRRLDQIHIDGILDANYVEELIKDAPWSPFKTIGSTERPDIVTAKLLEGHVAIFIDGTPVVLTAPYFFLEYFQTNDDYYTNFYSATFNRWLRILGFWATISLPAIFLGLFTQHQDLLPTRFLLNLSIARANLPFPTFLEMLLLILGFELIREGGAKAPANFGQTLGIVGGLVLGQAAVDAKLVSIPVVIIIAFTGITGLMIPQLKSPVILFRLGFLTLASLWGLPGYLVGLFFLLLHLSSLQSFTIPYTSSLSTNRRTMIQDTVFRAPWFHMIYRPKDLAPKNHRRQLRCLLFLLLPFFLTGCGTSREINDVALVTGITLERFEDTYEIRAQIFEEDQGEEQIKTLSAEGSTFEKSLSNLSRISNKDLYLHHSKSVALKGDFSPSDLYEITKYILDHREFRIASDVIFLHASSTSDPDPRKLQELLLTEEMKQNHPAPKIYQLFQRLSFQPFVLEFPVISVEPDGTLIPMESHIIKGGFSHEN